MLLSPEVDVPRKLQSLRQARLALGMTQVELSIASYAILGKQGIKGVHVNQIVRCELGGVIRELTATKLLMTLNELHKIRGRPELSIDDLNWKIRDRRPEEGEESP
jgi:hypothetical protein